MSISDHVMFWPSLLLFVNGTLALWYGRKQVEAATEMFRLSGETFTKASEQCADLVPRVKRANELLRVAATSEANDLELALIRDFAGRWAEKHGYASPTLTNFVVAIERKEHRK